MTRRTRVTLAHIGPQARIVTPELVAEGARKMVDPLARQYVDTFTVRVVGDLVDLNKLMRNRGARVRGVEACKDLFKAAWREMGCPVVKGQWSAHTHMRVGSRKKDPSNLYTGAIKAGYDALVEVGAIEGDGWANHVGPDGQSWEYVRGITCVTALTVTGVSGDF